MENKTIFQNPQVPPQPAQKVEDPLYSVANQPQEERTAPLFQAQPQQQGNYPPPSGQQVYQNSPLTDFYPQPKQKKGGGSSGKKIVSIFLSVFIVVAFILILALGAIFVLSNSSGNSSNSSGGAVTLTYWGLFEESSTMQGIINQFEKQNPGIKINYVKQDINQYRERLVTRIDNGTGPDIFRFHNTWYPMLSSELLPLPSDVITPDEFKLIYYPVMQKDLIKNGAIYGIPLEVDTLSLFINNTLFQAAGLQTPVTWDQFRNDATAMTVKDQNGKILTAGAAMGIYDNVDHAADILSLLMLQSGVDFSNIQAYSSQVQDAFNFYTSFTSDPKTSIWDGTLDPSTLAFSKGKLGMYFGYSQDYYTIKQYNPNLSFQVVPVPQLPGENVTLASYWVEGVSQKSKYQKEALMFMKFLAQKETQVELYQDEAKIRDFGEPYARVDLADNLKSNPNAYTFVAQAPYAQSSYFVSSTDDNGINQQLDGYLGTAINTILTQGTAPDATQTFIEAVSPILQQVSK